MKKHNLPNGIVSGSEVKKKLSSYLKDKFGYDSICIAKFKNQYYLNNTLIKEKKLDKEKIIVFTKKDLVQTPFEEKIKARNYKDSFVISVHNDEDIVSLRKYIIDYFLSLQPHFDLFIPFEKGHIHALLRAKTNIVQEENFEQGIFYRVKAPFFILDSLNLDEYKLAPTDKKVMK